MISTQWAVSLVPNSDEQAENKADEARKTRFSGPQTAKYARVSFPVKSVTDRSSLSHHLNQVPNNWQQKPACRQAREFCGRFQVTSATGLKQSSMVSAKLFGFFLSPQGLLPFQAEQLSPIDQRPAGKSVRQGNQSGTCPTLACSQLDAALNSA
ncbi:MAG: hypothetical protein P8L85_22085 [Rubripirellula sp.]|nr:hypothetical protein [Rubripirellula sp.]